LFEKNNLNLFLKVLALMFRLRYNESYLNEVTETERKMTNYDENRIKSAIAKLEDALAIIEQVNDSKGVSEEYDILLDLVRTLTCNQIRRINLKKCLL
jgi:hypothetical protein